MRAGPLDRRITIKGKSVEQSDSGQEVVTWSDVATVWAAKVENRGAERFAAMQIAGHAIRTFRFRWSPTVSVITVEHQVVCDGIEYDITDVREIGRHEGIEVDCFASSDEPVVP
jgi:SPP1 family predicted phage head-tail adaptor